MTIDELRAQIRAQLESPGPESPVLVATALAALRSVAPAEQTEPYVEALLDVVQYFNLNAQYALSSQPVVQAVDAARRLQNKRLLRRALMVQGLLHSETHNVPSAIECYGAALDLAIETQDKLGEGSIWANISGVMLYLGQHQDAIRAAERSVAVVGEEPRAKQTAIAALNNISVGLLASEENEAALTAALHAIERLGPAESLMDMTLRVVAEEHCTRALINLGRVSEAWEHAHQATHFSQAAGTERTALAASTAVGVCELASGASESGLLRLNRALDKARLIKSSYRDVLLALVQANEVLGKPREALAYLRELLSATRKLQQSSVIGQHREHLRRLTTNADASGQESSLARNLATLHRQAIAAELREDPSGEHCFRVARLSALLAKAAGHDDEKCSLIELCAHLHDIGKLGLPDALVCKRGRLSDEQMKMVQVHADIGAELLAVSDAPAEAVEIARHHHERWDGSGYPDGLRESAIPEVARIVALADCFDSMSHDRPHRSALPFVEVVAQIARDAGSKFDPGLTQRFLQLVARLNEEHGEGLDRYLGAAAAGSSFLDARRRIGHQLRYAT